MDATWQRLGDAAGTKGVGVQPGPRRAGQAADAAALARRVRGGLLRARAAPGSPGRTSRCTRCGPATASSTAPTSSSTRSSPARTGSTTSSSARGTRRSSAGCRARAPSGSGGRGSRGGPTIRGTAKPRRRRSATASRRSGRRTSSTSTRSSSSTAGPATTAPLATTERSDQAGFHWERLDPGGRGSVPHCHSEEEEVFVILEGEGTLHLWPSPSFAAGTRRGAGGRFRSAPATWSRGRPGRASATGSAQARAG